MTEIIERNTKKKNTIKHPIKLKFKHNTEKTYNNVQDVGKI